MKKDILDIACAIKSLYEKIFDVSQSDNELTEMKMHKLLYFAQKIHFSNFGEWLFEEEFEGWVHGPVNREVRSEFSTLNNQDVQLSLDEEYSIREVVFLYGQKSAIELRNLSHKDNAYEVSREGLGEYDRGNTIIVKEDIIADISKEMQIFNANDAIAYN
ncbi:Panacea domain-containing protein [Bacillus mobilis]|uniref:Panacea domain-containing protein n=1 Tax=Bacillus mobilis TaxID=2026190 RepID=UPI000A3013C2|nr:type II toxin-antitoxin system antitoxin SocA domain-containing protein [Bacillus mobilis]MCU5594800.1 DUF4065 domain-containing protein [Bacillus mobilis]MCU5738087.1 DUF4065 domain-containing protein [Bacillus mobilis]MCU9561698.1 DUF4065 domain-containing protein [Bacillus mobilis]SMD95197.1 hypothetical protein BACERE00177_01618 [Bacillus mobilis]HDR7517149.1 DUF4065 domain-containing protein [Bacillus mobilis]